MSEAPVVITGPFMEHIAAHPNVGRAALVIGNGIHRYPEPSSANDWNGMIAAMARRHGLVCADHLEHLSLTEVYDLVGLSGASVAESTALAKEFCAPMRSWVPSPHHRWIMRWATAKETPVLTTNFDGVLSSAVGARFQSLFKPTAERKRESDRYPWEKHYALKALEYPREGFGIWHVNGLIRHSNSDALFARSIRLGLSDYMAATSRAHGWLHGGAGRLFGDSEIDVWRGRNTWLDIIFHMPLVFFGLGLGRDEVFLRWLLIQRARYFAQHPDRKQPAWYVYPLNEAKPEDQAKYFFLDKLGVTPLAVADYHAIYGQAVWPAI